MIEIILSETENNSHVDFKHKGNFMAWEVKYDTGHGSATITDTSQEKAEARAKEDKNFKGIIYSKEKEESKPPPKK